MIYHLKTHQQGKQLMTSNELSLHYSKITAAPFKYYKCFSLLNDSRFGGNQQSNGLSLFIDYYYNAFKAISFLRLCFSKTSWSQGVCVCLCTESSTFTMLWWLWVWLPQPAGPLSFAGPHTSLESHPRLALAGRVTPSAPAEPLDGKHLLGCIPVLASPGCPLSPPHHSRCS